MNSLLKEGLKQECNLLKLKTKKVASQSRYVIEMVFGWAIMLGATPYAAMHVSNESILCLIGGFLVVCLFLLGSMFVGNAMEGFEEASREKTVGELLAGVELLKGTPPRSHAH